MMFTIEQYDDMIIIAKHGEGSGLQGMFGFLIIDCEYEYLRKNETFPFRLYTDTSVHC